MSLFHPSIFVFKWTNPGLFWFICVLFAKLMTEQLLTLAGLEIGLLELKASTLTT